MDYFWVFLSLFSLTFLFSLLFFLSLSLFLFSMLYTHRQEWIFNPCKPFNELSLKVNIVLLAHARTLSHTHTYIYSFLYSSTHCIFMMNAIENCITNTRARKHVVQYINEEKPNQHGIEFPHSSYYTLQTTKDKYRDHVQNDIEFQP